MALRNGVGRKTVSGMPGHRSAEFAQDICINAAKDMRRAAAEKNGGFITEML